MPDERVEQIGRYRIVDVLGEGAMGVVYRAQDTVLDRMVAVKVMADAIAREPDLRERFLREARAAGGLQHPNVVTIYDFGEADGYLFIAMELVPGVDLSYVLSHGVPLPLDTKLAVVAGLLTGLAYAHKRGVVHRDVKPANVRVTEDGAVKIMDFGIAHVASSELTRTGMTMGTPSYMAPEQVEGTHVSPATDIFASGVVLYELLSGAKPFVGPTLHSILYKIVSEEPADVFTGVAGIPASLPPIVFRALAKDPAERYADALVMAHDLNRVRAELSQNAGTAGIVAAVASATSVVSPLRTRPGGLPGGGAAVGVISFPPVTGAGSLGAGSFPPGTFGSADRSGANASGANTSGANAFGAGSSGSRAGAAASGGGTLGARLPAADASGSTGAALGAARATPARRTPLIAGVASLVLVAGLGVWAVARRPAAAPSVVAQGTTPSAAPSAVAPALPNEQPAAGAATSAAAPVPAATVAGRSPITSTPATGSTAPTGTRPAPGVGAATTPQRPSASASVGSPATTPATPAAPPNATHAVVVPPPAPPASVAAPTQPAAAPASAAPTAAGVREALDAYARALETRDLAAVRRVYPAISDRQESGWRALFDATKSLDVTLAVGDVNVSGTTATATVTGQSAFVMTDNHRQTQPLNFRATLHYDGSAWRLAAVQ